MVTGLKAFTTENTEGTEVFEKWQEFTTELTEHTELKL